MDKKELPPLPDLLAVLCLVGIGIMRAADGEDGFSITTHYLGLGVTLAGASLKILTKPGAAILALGIAGNIFFDSYKPVCISAAALVCWYLIDFTLTDKYKDKTN